jgi:hypothetical protein
MFQETMFLVVLVLLCLLPQIYCVGEDSFKPKDAQRILACLEKLGIAEHEELSLTRINQAFRKLALKCHPDKFGGDETKAEEYKVLSRGMILCKKSSMVCCAFPSVQHGWWQSEGRVQMIQGQKLAAEVQELLAQLLAGLHNMLHISQLQRKPFPRVH